MIRVTVCEEISILDSMVDYPIRTHVEYINTSKVNRVVSFTDWAGGRVGEIEGADYSEVKSVLIMENGIAICCTEDWVDILDIGFGWIRASEVESYRKRTANTF